jgi:hypothetical protein
MVKYPQMKFAAVVLVALLVHASAFAVARVVVPLLSVSQFADTEVSTNFAINASRSDVWQMDLHLQLEGTPTNDLEVAFGRDVNTNGVLDVEEIETMYGWRGGRYFIENVNAWERIEEEAATNALCGVCDIHLENNSSVVPRRFAATCGGVAAFASLSVNPTPAWLFRREWNMVRVVRRGAGISPEWVRCDIEYQSFSIRLR